MFGIYARISALGHEHTKSDAYSAAVIQVSNDQGAEYNAIRAGLHVRIHMPLTSTESHCDLDLNSSRSAQTVEAFFHQEFLTVGCCSFLQTLPSLYKDTKLHLFAQWTVRQ